MKFLFRKNKKLKISALILLFLLVATSLGGIFLYEKGTRRLQTEVERALLTLKERGYLVSYSRLEVKKNPLFPQIIFHNPSLKSQRSLLAWTGEGIAVETSLWDWKTFTLTFLGPQTLSLPPSFPIDALRAEGVQGTLHITGAHRLNEISVSLGRLEGFKTGAPSPFSLQDLSVKANSLIEPLLAHLSFKAHVHGLESIKKVSPTPLTVSGDLSLSGFQGKTFPRSLEEWREGGGVLDIHSLTLAWPPITGKFEGTLAFDQDMYPLGSFSSHLKGYPEALNFFVEKGWVKKKNATMILFALNMLSDEEKEGQPSITIPLTFQNRRLSLGGISLWKMK